MRWGFDFFLKLTANSFPAHGQIIPVKCARIQFPNRKEDRGQISQGGNNNNNKNGDKHHTTSTHTNSGFHAVDQGFQY